MIINIGQSRLNIKAVYLAGNILRLTRVKETAIQKFSENFLD